MVNPSRQEREFIGYDWTLDISKDWTLTNRFAFSNTLQAQRLDGLATVNATTGLITRNVYDVNVQRLTLSSNLDLNGKFATGPVNHAVLIGTDYYSSDIPAYGFTGKTPEVGPINMYFPVYNFSGYVKPENNFYYHGVNELWKGVYAQDMLSFAEDRLHLLIGARYDWADSSVGSSSISFAQANGPYNATTGTGLQNGFDQALSPRFGAVVQPTSWLSFFGDFSQSFGATNALPAPGKPLFPPQVALQWEGGAKAELLDKRVTASVAFYDITKSNVAETIPGTQFSTLVGLVESKGAEFNVAGRINENWSLIGSYSFDDARITQDATKTNVGHRLQDVPLNAGNIWVKYDAYGDLTGLSLGGGLYIVGERQGDNANDFQLPAYTLVNTMIMYHFQPMAWPWVKNLTAQLNVKNLLNTTYYTSAASRTSIYPGEPRTILVSLRAEF